MSSLPDEIHQFDTDGVPTGSICGIISAESGQEIPGYATIQENYLILSYNRKINILPDIRIPIIGILETKVMPHPAVMFFPTSLNIEDDEMPGILVLTYLTDVFDNTSNVTITFGGLRKHLLLMKENIDKAAGTLKQRVSFEDPDLNRKVTKIIPTTNFQLIGTSMILNQNEIDAIRLAFPGRFKRNPWLLAYASHNDGTSLYTMTSKTQGKKPLVMVIKTGNDEKIGAYLSTGIDSTARGYIGTGETFVFNFSPQIQVYKWSRQNSFFLAISTEEISIGGGGGNAIFIGNNLRKGISDPCATFNSPRLTSRTSFSVIDIEIWSVVSSY